MNAMRAKLALEDPEFWRLTVDLSQLELTWTLLAKKALQPGFVETRDRTNVMTWPDFATAWRANQLHEVSTLRVAIDFSGYQSAEIGWILPLRRVRTTYKPLRESLIVVLREGQPRLAARAEYAPRDRRGAPGEMWTLYHDELLWREPGPGIITLPQGATAPSDPDLTILPIESFERGALRTLFTCEA